jgi:hypothetical protein
VDTTYSNAHATQLRKLLARINQTDLYRLVNGDSQGGYTRSAATVHTRIDRIYSRLYNSPWHCNTAREDPTLFAGEAPSNHLPVVITFDTPAARAATKYEAKIDTNIFRNKATRAGVEVIWHNAYTQFPPSTYGHPIPWQRAKTATAEFLLAESSAIRREARPTTYIINKLKLAHEIQSTEGPTQVIVDRINALNQELKNAHKKEHKRHTWLTYVRSLKEE